jgi:hypothetical protein
MATARRLDAATASDSLGEMLGLGSVTAKDVYATLDWLGSEQSFIETALARRHLSNGALLLYDVTSTYLEGRCCELARHGLAGITDAIVRNWSSVCFAPSMAARWRSRSSKATPPIR